MNKSRHIELMSRHTWIVCNLELKCRHHEVQKVSPLDIKVLKLSKTNDTCRHMNCKCRHMQIETKEISQEI